MREDFYLLKKYHNFLLCSFSLFLLQCSNIIKIIISINSKHFYFFHLTNFHILRLNKDGSIEDKYNYNVIENESHIQCMFKRKYLNLQNNTILVMMDKNGVKIGDSNKNETSISKESFKMKEHFLNLIEVKLHWKVKQGVL